MQSAQEPTRNWTICCGTRYSAGQNGSTPRKAPSGYLSNTTKELARRGASQAKPKCLGNTGTRTSKDTRRFTGEQAHMMATGATGVRERGSTSDWTQPEENS